MGVDPGACAQTSGGEKDRANALDSPLRPERETPRRSSPRFEPFKATIDAVLIEDTTAPRKQRTAHRIFVRLMEEHGAQQLSYSTVRGYVRIRWARVDVEAGRRS